MQGWLQCEGTAADIDDSWDYLFVLHAWFHSDLQGHRFPSILDIVTLLTFLCLELLEHARPNLLGDHLHFAVALSLTLSWLDHIPVPCDLHVQLIQCDQVKLSSATVCLAAGQVSICNIRSQRFNEGCNFLFDTQLLGTAASSAIYTNVACCIITARRMR